MNMKKIKVNAVIEVVMDFWTVEAIRNEMHEILGEGTPALTEFDLELYKKIIEVKKLFKDYDED